MFRPFFRHAVEPRWLVFAAVTGGAGSGDLRLLSREFGQQYNNPSAGRRQELAAQ
jgi:hypothetical protein